MEYLLNMLTSRIIVIVHDVTPYYEQEIVILLNMLKPLINNNIAAAVVPDWHDMRLSFLHKSFNEILKNAFGELLLHGLTHYRNRSISLYSMLTNHSDEFVGLHTDEIASRLHEGQHLFYQIFGSKARGFVPPAWKKGYLHAELLAAQGIDYCLDMFSIHSFKRNKIPLATWSWDWGQLNCLGYVGEVMGTFLFHVRTSTPCIVFHPKDVTTGYVQLGIKRVKNFLHQGFRPVLPWEVILHNENA
jgi:predicted deacetylase